MTKKVFVAAATVVLGGIVAIAAPAPQGAGTATTAPATTTASRPARQLADKPAPRAARGGTTDANWMRRHDSLVTLAKKGDIDLYFDGDSITDFWQTASPRGGKAIWEKEFSGWKAADFGISADLTQHVLWRIQNGELDGVHAKVIVLMIGTNNLPGNAYTVDEVAAGVKAIVDTFKEKQPQAKILLLGIFPRNATAEDPTRKKIGLTNEIISKLDDGKQVKYMDIGAKFLAPDGTLSKDIMPDLLHPNEKGYIIWADAIKPQLTEWLGTPAAPQPK